LWCSWCSHFGSEYFIFGLIFGFDSSPCELFSSVCRRIQLPRECSAAHVRLGVKAQPRRRARVSPSPAARRNGFSRVLPPRAAARVLFVLSRVGAAGSPSVFPSESRSRSLSQSRSLRRHSPSAEFPICCDFRPFLSAVRVLASFVSQSTAPPFAVLFSGR
jgi:hypothetical protein